VKAKLTTQVLVAAREGVKMNKSNAEAAAQQMADVFAEKAKRSSESELIREQVYRAVFNQAHNFIPDSAIFDILHSQGEPQLIALDGRQRSALGIVWITPSSLPSAWSAAESIASISALN
jgi:hypothetical protein